MNLGYLFSDTKEKCRGGRIRYFICFPHIVLTVQSCSELCYVVLLFFSPSSPPLLRRNSILNPRMPSLTTRRSLWATMTIIDLYATVYLAVSHTHLRSSIQVLSFLSFQNHCPLLMLALRFSPIRGRYGPLDQLEFTDIRMLCAAWYSSRPQLDRS